MKKMSLLLVASLVSLSLVACGSGSDANSKVSDESVATETETVAKSEEKKNGHGQSSKDYEGTGLELFGLSYESNYVNLVDCTAEDLVWFVQGLGINYDTSDLNYKLEPYAKINTRFGGGSKVEVYNPHNFEIYAKDAKISYVEIDINSDSANENYGKYKDITVDGLNLFSDITSDILKEYIDKNNLTIDKNNVHNKFEDSRFQVTIPVNLPSGQEAEVFLYYFKNSSTRSSYTMKWKLPQIME